MENNLDLLIGELKKESNPKQAKVLSGFFKTKKGEYGEGDIFLGIKVPVQRKISKKYDLSFEELQKLLDSKIHEYRMCALFILIKKYETATKEKNTNLQNQAFEFYINNVKKGNINNWDLVDLSAPNICGEFIFNNPENKKTLYELASSGKVWEKRVAIISTFAFIKNKSTKDTYKIAEILLNDEHDLIQKAVGWMLRECGKRVNEKELCQFLEKYSKKMPRTMLRYSIERLSKQKKKHYMLK
jgi:3-methyladenine DNA glycosylase AlkD